MSFVKGGLCLHPAWGIHLTRDFTVAAMGREVSQSQELKGEVGGDQGQEGEYD